jgi:DNA-directed RNA polymerase subunit K/omega
VERLWLDEAATRASQIDAGAVDLVDGEDVERKARALLG